MRTDDAPELCVVGFVSFEVFVPPIATWPDPGQELFVRRMAVGLGGALRSASVAKALGVGVTIAAPIGRGITGSATIQGIDELGISRLAWPAPAHDPALSLVLSTPRDRSMVSAVDLDAMAGCPELPVARWIHVCGLKEARAAAPRLKEARAKGAKVSVSAGRTVEELQSLSAQKDRAWDLLVMNAEEAAIAAGDAASAPKLLQGAARDVIVTEGKSGAFGRLDGKEVRASGHPIQVVDPTGAGDAFAGGLLAAVLQGVTGSDCLVWGVRAAEGVLGIRGGVAPQGLFAGWAPRP